MALKKWLASVLFGLVLMMGIGSAATLYVKADTPNVEEQLREMVIRQGGVIANAPPGDYTIQVTTNPDTMTGYHINPIPVIATAGTAIFAKGWWKAAGLLSLLFAPPMVPNKPQTNVALIFAKRNRLLDHVTKTVPDNSDGAILGVVNDFGDTLSGWIQTATSDQTSGINPGVNSRFVPAVNSANRNRYTGVVIDALGLSPNGSVVPQIYDETGRLIYDNSNTSPEAMVATKDLPSGLQNGRAGAHPLVVQAVDFGDTPDGSAQSIIVSRADGDKILSANQNGHFLEQANVVFVMNPEVLQNEPQPIENNQSAPQENGWNIDSGKWQKIAENQQLFTEVNQAPPAVMNLYGALSVTDKVKLYNKLHGTTATPMGDIDNKQAFISGQVMGHDVFDILRSQLDEQLRAGKISQEDYAKNNEVLQVTSGLTPEQRSMLVSVLEIDVEK